MPKNKLIKATKDSFVQFNDDLITMAELNMQLQAIALKHDDKNILGLFLDNLYKEFNELL